jgi:hypothetical protein
VGIALATLIVALSAGIAVAAMLFVRRRAPEGSHFKDGDRAAGVFGVLATGFSILLGFVVFLAFTSYDNSRSGAEREAVLVVQQYETAQFLPESLSERLSGEIACYARSVVNDEWPAMENGTLGDTFNPWGFRMFQTLLEADPVTPAEETAYGKWLDQSSDRQDARNDRVHGSEGVVPTPLWIVLFLTAGVIFVFLLFFADSEEHGVVQGMLVGSVVTVIVASMCLLWFLDNPYHEGVGGLEPVAMERTIELIDDARAAIGQDEALPCTPEGRPLEG